MEDPATDGKKTKVSEEEASEEQRRKAAVADAQKHAGSVVIQPGDYQIHIHVLMVRRATVVTVVSRYRSVPLP